MGLPGQADGDGVENTRESEAYARKGAEGVDGGPVK